eukprot:TRINITY_DN3765_c2_g1_i1.p2 TRINITY_DN3765_c2_g1~~TRINITY_DN3765_c2_g1_i1.p2  ORF type:complete len:104 (+),score=2.56 TRINITY_DN3765_c2_g1_i1:311-622(+)
MCSCTYIPMRVYGVPVSFTLEPSNIVIMSLCQQQQQQRYIHVVIFMCTFHYYVELWCSGPFSFAPADAPPTSCAVCNPSYQSCKFHSIFAERYCCCSVHYIFC